MKIKPNWLTIFAFIFISTLIPLYLLERPVAASASTPSPEDIKQATTEAHRQAIRKPFDEDAVKAYIKTLPKEGEYFIVEGDLLFTEQELRADLVSKSSGAKPVDPTSELIVKVRDGEREFYKTAAERDLTYAIARSSFPGNDPYEIAVKNMREATKAWEDACKKCGIKFRHLAQYDASPNHDLVNFIVRYHHSGGQYIAAAFFPHDDKSRRFINLDPSYFSENLQPLTVGILRHELGHTLGYRHEQLQDATLGCYKERENEPDGLWMPLTAYDSKSVMHYQCGLNAGGKLNPKLILSSNDIAGHAELYRPPTSDPSTGFSFPDATLEIHRQAYRKPFDEVAVKAYIATLPKDREYFVIEGDIRITEQELRAYLATKTLSSKPASAGRELLVNVTGGELDFYRNVSERKLTYAVDRASFKSLDQYNAVVKEMQLAAQSWQEACEGCGLNFTYLQQQDEAPSNDKVNFTVRYHDSGGAFIAAAFFPHDEPSRRFIDIDPSFFRPELKSVTVGVLRHELGHTLGYRHEHIENIPGCRNESGKWVRLTPYDRNSVMHYWCGDGGNPLLELSKSDKEGHLKLYGNSNAPSTAFGFERPEVIIRLEGGDVPENTAAVLSALNELGLLQIDKHRVDANETIDSIYKDKLDIPFFASGLKKFAGDLNRTNYDVQRLKPGEILLYPKVDVSKYEYSIKLDRFLESDKRRLESLMATDAALLESQKDEPEKGVTKLTFRGFEIRVPLDSPVFLNRLREKLKSIPSENLLIFNSKPTVRRGFAVYASGQSVEEPADKFMQKATTPPPLENNVQGLIGSFVGLTKMPEGLDACTRGPACPEIVLVDSPVELHPDIAQAIKTGGNKSLGRSKIVENDRQIIELGIFNTNDHGTYMAGIIASQNNNYGLVGLHPGAHITAVDRAMLETNPSEFADLLEQRSDASGMQIYVFASSWLWKVPEKDRITSNVVARKISNLAPLWITAAGQKITGGEDIRAGFENGPMSLGFLKNVLVVTAYQDDQNVPRLLLDAHYSTQGLVHIAAPGKAIPSTVSVSKYAFADGTSPATAFVAGVASAMVSKWEYYTTAERVKFRLQLTAKPSLTGEDANKVVSGVLDPVAALRDPNKIWLQDNEGDYKEVSLNHWCGSTLHVITPNGAIFNNGTIPFELIYRLYKDGNTGNWFVFTKVRTDDGDTLPGTLRRIGPGTLKLDNQLNPVLFQSADGALYTTLSFSDLILPHGLPVGNCQIPSQQ